MPPKINPLRPGSPVNPDMFVGRLGEVEQLEGALFQTRADHPSHFMITGEGGIGKTSLLHYLRYLASGDVALGDESLNFLVIDCDLSEVSTLPSLLMRIESTLTRKLGKTERARKFLADAWSFLQRIEIADSRIRERNPTVHPDILIDEFVGSVCTT